MMKILLFVLIFGILIQISFASKFPIQRDIEISRSISNEGFHRELKTEIHVLTEDLPHARHCIVTLSDQLPSSFYLNPYQLDDLLRLGDLDVEIVLSGTPDLESPAYTASPLDFKTLIPLYIPAHSSQVTRSFSFPLHHRHHRPTATPDPAYKTIEIPFPTNLNVFCTDENGTEPELTAGKGLVDIAERNMQFFQELQMVPVTSERFVKSVVPGSSRKMRVADPLRRISVPLPEKNQAVWVEQVTVGTVYVGLAFVMISVAWRLSKL